MKKFLSLMLTLALIITTIAVPLSAFAAAPKPGDDRLTITFDAQNAKGTINEQNKVKPGDTFTVAVKVKAQTGIKASSADITLKYDKSVFEYQKTEGNTTDWTVKTFDKTDGCIVQLTNINDVSITNEDTTIGTITFKAVGTTEAKYDLDSYTTTKLMVDDKDWYTVSAQNLTVNKAEIFVEANKVVAKVDGAEIPAKDYNYYNTTGITLSYEGTNVVSAIYQKEGGDETSFLSAETPATAGSVAISDEGKYTVKVKAEGMTEAKTYTFNYYKTALDVKLKAVPDKAQYKAGETITIPVTISGLPENKTASVVKFKVTADSEDVTLTEPALDNGYVKYDSTEDGKTALSNNGVVATLKYTVSETAKNGNVKFTFSDEGLALTTAAINPQDTPIAFDAKTKTVTIVPNKEHFATVSAPDNKKAWSGDDAKPYDLSVTPEQGAEVKYIKSSGAVDTSDLAARWNDGTSIDKGNLKIEVNSGDTIYVFAKIGDVYDYVGKYENGKEIFYDATAPVINNSTADMTEWASTVENNYELNLTGKITAIDEMSQVGDGFYYTAPGVTEATKAENNKIIIAQGTSVKDTDETYKVYVKDRAGNISEGKTVKLMLDGDKPEITDQNIGVETDGKIKLSFTAKDVTSGIKTKKMIKEVAEGEAEVEITPDSNGDYYVTQTGNYILTVTDNANNSTTYKFENVEFSNITEATSLSVKVVKNNTEYASKRFFNSEATELDGFTDSDGNKTNGKFTYVNLKLDTQEGTTSEVTLDGNKVETPEDGFEVTAVGKHTVVVKTTNSKNSGNTKAATYYFEIVNGEDMPSVDGDGYYDILDFSFVRRVVGQSTEGKLPGSEDGFTGGIFSGDVTGDLTLKADDFNAIIQALRDGKFKGEYDFPIFNAQN